ncbi:hypothetical protein C8R46DRAFT_1043051 [Mycena filopes]|nr:hypothetical protein C8R46DRAFT_1043051 [Mycena filopes]
MPAQKFVVGFIIGVPCSLVSLAAIDALKNEMVHGNVSKNMFVITVLTTNLCVLNIIFLRSRLRSIHLRIQTAFKTPPFPASTDRSRHEQVSRSLPVLCLLILSNYAAAFLIRFASRFVKDLDTDQAHSPVLSDADSDNTLIDELSSDASAVNAPASPARPSSLSPSTPTIALNHLLFKPTSGEVIIPAALVPSTPSAAAQVLAVKAKNDWKPLMPLSFQWAEGGCPTRITIPLNSSAPEFVPRVRAGVDKLSGVVFPPVQVVAVRKPLFLATPPSFWAPGGCAVPIVAPVDEV